MSHTSSLSLASALALVALASLLPSDAQPQNKSANSTRTEEKPAPVALIFVDVPRENKNYARLQDLQQKGVLAGYPEGLFSNKRTLTRYDFAIAIKHVTDSMSLQTLAQDGKKLQSTFGIPNTLKVEQAQEILAVWLEFQPELKQLGFKPDGFERVRKTLQIYTAASGADLPQDFLFTFKAVNAAYERKDIEGIFSHYDPDCAFIVVTPEYHLEYKDANDKPVKDKLHATRQQHDLAWQRQELQRLFFVTRQPLEKDYALPLQTISVTSNIQKAMLNREATELRLTVKREIHLHQGQVQGIKDEVDEEIWGKGAQGWKLKRRTINSKGGLTVVS